MAVALVPFVIDRALPAQIVAMPKPTTEDAQRTLMEESARALGVATLRDLRDYFRLSTADAAARLRELLDASVLVAVEVEGWKHPGYMHAQTRLPRSASATALLSPFDSLIWERQRTERLFDFAYRLEIYTPAHKRLHGYYVLPFLHGDRIVGRVDLKSDRQNSQLLVKGGSAEADVKEKSIAEPLMAELKSLANWLGLETVKIASRRGELMKQLKRLA